MLSESPRCGGGSRCCGVRAARECEDRERLPEAVVLEPCERWDGDPDAVLLGRAGVTAVVMVDGDVTCIPCKRKSKDNERSAEKGRGYIRVTKQLS
ncbi:hypothetical protein DPX16_22638 [Anabarilius grahami]|uniref:Uncharacterized protein n=1 Tax=Anabarilius grahami TaxID=495550 RepID=A0A3N0Y5V2_ANAGA|nr:hypothetical protein DPX16_22638 [Anabarilius grahami]